MRVLLFLSSILVLNFFSNKQNTFSNIEIYNSNNLIVVIKDTLIKVNYKQQEIYKGDILKDFHLNYNEKRDVLFLNDSCFTINKFDANQLLRYKYSSSNWRFDIEKYNDSLLVINNYILSEIDLCNAIESEEYLGEDSINFDGNTLYVSLTPKKYQSNVYNIKNYEKILPNDVAKINIIENFIITYSLAIADSNEWGYTYFFDQNIYDFKSNELNLLYSTEKNDTVNRKVGYEKLSTFSSEIDSIYFFSDELFFLFKTNTVDIYEHQATERPIFNKESVPVDSILISHIDSIKLIPFYNKAFITYQEGNKYLNFTWKANVESYQFNILKINDYFINGEERFLSYNLLLFSLDSIQHFLTRESNYFYRTPQCFYSFNPIDSLYSNYEILDTIPVNSIQY